MKDNSFRIAHVDGAKVADHLAFRPRCSYIARSGTRPRLLVVARRCGLEVAYPKRRLDSAVLAFVDKCSILMFLACRGHKEVTMQLTTIRIDKPDAPIQALSPV